MTNEVLTLMFKDLEVLVFSVDYEEEKVSIIKKLDHYELAPFGVNDKANNPSSKLNQFFRNRAIPPQRYLYEDILKATGCRSGYELSFKGHGLSLTNHYWFKREGEDDLKYDDINFFTNKWDDSFARNLIAENISALATCSLNVPDIVTPGWGIKGWLYEEDGPRLYKLGIVPHTSEEAVVECLDSRLASRLFKEGEYVNYELRKINDRYASTCKPFINIDEEIITLSTLLPNEFNILYSNKSVDKRNINTFLDAFIRIGRPELKLQFIKLFCLRSLCFMNDLHFGNIAMIHNLKTNEYKVAPFYDLASGFGSSERGKAMIANPTKATFFIVYYLYSDLDPSWDYSWYDPKCLDGFEDEIRDYLAKAEFYTDKLIETIILVYQQQKETLHKVINKR